MNMAREWTNEDFDSYVRRRWMADNGGIEKMSDCLRTRVVKGQYTDIMYIVEDGPAGDAFIRSRNGPIEFTRGPVGWNPINCQMLNRLINHVSSHQSDQVKYKYILDREEAKVTINAGDEVAEEIDWSHQWHPDHGIYQRETFRDLLERGRMAPYYDINEGSDVSDPEAGRESYFELETISGARNRFRFRRVRRRGEEAAQAAQCAVKLRITTSVEHQEE